MQRNIRETALHGEVQDHFRRSLEPAFGELSGLMEPQPSPDGDTIVFTGTQQESLEESPVMRLYAIAARGGAPRRITGGPNSDRAPRWLPDGSILAFLSDRAEAGTFALYLLDRDSPGEARPTPPVEGTVEFMVPSPDGATILLGVAGHGADRADVQGSGTHATRDTDAPAWLPEVEDGTAGKAWRRLWLHDVASETTRLLSREGLNVWEAAWLGPDRIAAVVSDDPGEGAWYSAALAVIDPQSGTETVVHRPRWQLGMPAGSPDGRYLAVIEAVCSDRMVVAGALMLVDPATGQATAVDTNGADITYLVWRNAGRLLYGGIRGFESVVGEYDPEDGSIEELWSTRAGTSVYYPDPSPTLAPLGDDGFVLTMDGARRPPELTIVRNGDVHPLFSLAHGGTEYLQSLGGTLEEVAWTGRDGLPIAGLLFRPEGPPPYPLVVQVHGGPVFAYRNSWSGLRQARLLASRGFATLFPNPRGSAGRGRDFAAAVVGDVGGQDAEDILCGVDALIERGLVDGARVGLTGGSYGGFMASWLITQTDRFAASVSICPTTNWATQHRTSNIPGFTHIFLEGRPDDAGSQFYTRSPVMFAGSTRTPTLLIAGGNDRCTPPSQAIELHQALREQGVPTALVIYPQEGHGIRALPALIDLTARLVGWFERYMPARR